MARAKKQKLSLEELLEKAILKGKDIPYEIPGNWVWTELDYISKWGSGGTPSRKNLEFYSGNIPWIKTGELNNGYIYDTEEKITEEAIKKSSAKLFPINTVAIAMYGATIGKVGIFAVEATTNQACACAIPNNCIQYKYLFYYLQSQKEIFIEKGKGGAQPNISQEIIKRHYFPMPPLPEQQRIVERIESLFEKLDAAKELVQSTLDSFENRKAAILHKALTGELTAKWREENGIDLNSWEEKKIKDICNVVRGGSPRPAGDPKYYEGNIPFLKVADVTRCVGPYITEFQYTIKEAGLNRTRMVEANTLLMSNSGATLGVPKICSFNTTFNDGIAAFINTEGINIEFHYFFWESKTNELRAINKGAAQPNLNTDIIGNIEIKLPLIQEQEEIVRILRKLLVEEQQAQELCNIIEKIDLMKQSILARAFRGELGTNNPEEENAIELLKEVLKEKL